jgi:hypothetical protein
MVCPGRRIVTSIFQQVAGRTVCQGRRIVTVVPPYSGRWQCKRYALCPGIRIVTSIFRLVAGRTEYPDRRIVGGRAL